MQLALAWARGARPDDFRPVLDDAFERADPTLAEVEPAGERFDAHLQVLELDPVPRRLEHEVVQHFVVQRVPVGARPIELDLAALLALEQVDVELDLLVQRRDQRVRVEEQLQRPG